MGLGLLADLIKRLEEENKVNVYLCQEKIPKVRLPKDMHSKRARISKDLEKTIYDYFCILFQFFGRVFLQNIQ